VPFKSASLLSPASGPETRGWHYGCLYRYAIDSHETFYELMSVIGTDVGRNSHPWRHTSSEPSYCRECNNLASKCSSLGTSQLMRTKNAPSGRTILTRFMGARRECITPGLQGPIFIHGVWQTTNGVVLVVSDPAAQETPDLSRSQDELCMFRQASDHPACTGSAHWNLVFLAITNRELM